MNQGDDGYTLGECLVALFVIGLAISGLTAGAASIGRLQASAVAAAKGDRTVRAVHEGLSELLADAGPFPSGRNSHFQGSGSRFDFDCDDHAASCGAWLTSAGDGMMLHIADGRRERVLPLPGVKSAKFVYAGTATIGPSWPVDGPYQQVLRSVGILAVTADGDTPITSARVWVEQRPDCEFDAISQRCRT